MADEPVKNKISRKHLKEVFMHWFMHC